ncbi:MAG: 50S ribosomal protein L31 [Anaerolineales bacterium]|nr:50S ribosomal protein L31 [Anaerolineales bacterium]
MREKIHPKYFASAKIICACGNTWNTGSTREVIHTDVCSKCHPFFTGEQRIVDTEGQVDRFYKKLEARTQFQQQVAAREAAKAVVEQSITALGLDERVVATLSAAGLGGIPQVLEGLAAGDEAFLTASGLGRKNLIDLKKRLRARGLLKEEAGEAEAA